jgi:serine acetyltransferase
VTIGEGAVIGSGAVVTRDVEPWTVNVGTPARAIATRPSATVKRLDALAYERLGVVPMDATELVALKRDTLQLPTER